MACSNTTKACVVGQSVGQFVVLFALLQIASLACVRQVVRPQTIVIRWKTNDALNVLRVDV